MENKNLHRFSADTLKGNRVEFFFNANTNLIVVDLVHKCGVGGNELVRLKFHEKEALQHCEEGGE